MSGLKQIKGKIAAMQKSQTVTKAMEAVSAAKMRKAQSRALGGRAYARAAATVLSRLSNTHEIAEHPLATPRPEAQKALYIVITSDKGLAGALNSAVLKAAAADIRAQGLSKEQVTVATIGKKAHDYFAAREYPLAEFMPNTDVVSSATIRGIVQFAQSRYTAGQYRFVKIVYQNFVSTFEQRPTTRQVFPLSLAELEAILADITPKRAAVVDTATADTYTIEPSEQEVLNTVLPMLASIVVYHALLESQASEHSARMVAMKGATDKAGEMQESLTLQFNKARQAAITREVSEIIGGMEALRN